MDRRRSYEDPLTEIRHPTWLVGSRNMLGRLLEVTPLEPYADLRAIVNAAREKRIAEGWLCSELGRHNGDFFSERDGVRLLVSVRRVEPGKSTALPSGSWKARQGEP